jgi:hypothetical protein
MPKAAIRSCRHERKTLTITRTRNRVLRHAVVLLESSRLRSSWALTEATEHHR